VKAGMPARYMAMAARANRMGADFLQVETKAISANSPGG
jgi:hypothetical protein